MKRETLNRLGLAAVILLAPGGFILGAALAANHYRRKSREPGAAPGDGRTDGPDADPPQI